MMTIRRNMNLAARRVGKSFWRYFSYVLIFTAATAVGYLVQAVASAWFYTQQGMSPTEVITYYFYQQSMGEAFFEAYPGMTLISYELVEASIAFYYITTLASSAISLIGAGIFALPCAALFLSLALRKPITLGEAMKLWAKGIPLALLYAVKVLLWSLLFIVPGIVKAIAWSQCFFVKVENPDMKAADCLKRSAEITEGRRGYYFGMIMLYALFTAGISYVASMAYTFVDSVVYTLLIENASTYALVSAVLSSALSFVAPALVAVRQNTSRAIYYVDAKYSYVDSVEADLREKHEAGIDSENPFDVEIREDMENFIRKMGGTVVTPTEKDKKDDIDPFE